MAIVVAALIIPFFLAAILVKLLLDLYAEEPDSPESRQAQTAAGIENCARAAGKSD